MTATAEVLGALARLRLPVAARIELAALVAGMRPAVLLDVHVRDMQALEDLLRRWAPAVRRVTMGSDTTFFVDVEHMASLCAPDAPHVLVIDATGGAGRSPVVHPASADIERELRRIASEIVQGAERVDAGALSECAIAGFLLGFACVYHIDPSAADNCLGDVPLDVCTLQATPAGSAASQRLASFSVPAHLRDRIAEPTVLRRFDGRPALFADDAQLIWTRHCSARVGL